MVKLPIVVWHAVLTLKAAVLVWRCAMPPPMLAPARAEARHCRTLARTQRANARHAPTRSGRPPRRPQRRRRRARYPSRGCRAGPQQGQTGRGQRKADGQRVWRKTWGVLGTRLHAADRGVPQAPGARPQQCPSGPGRLPRKKLWECYTSSRQIAVSRVRSAWQRRSGCIGIIPSRHSTLRTCSEERDLGGRVIMRKNRKASAPRSRFALPLVPPLSHRAVTSTRCSS